ncbi:hypothetical protein [Treponema sp.]|uniref:hypothetical protein n=1 Tax=Treponema sp. TaxID=166 RepID=UPI003EFE9A93
MIKSKLVLAAAIAVIPFALTSCGSTPKEEPEITEEIIQQDTEETQTKDVESSEDISELNKSTFSKIEASRQDAINAGAKEKCPDAFNAAEEEFSAVKSAMDSGEDVSARLKDLLARYQALKAYADAVSKKAKIDENGFASYAQNTYNEGASLIEELAGSKDYGSEWNSKALSADEKMTLVLKAAYKSLAQAERVEAFKAKKNADSIKCSVSRKAEYDKFVGNFKTGDQNYVTGNPEGSLENYKKAKEGFTNLYTQVLEARSQAQAAIDEAKKRVAESETNAQLADKEKPLGNEPVEGIEEEDTKLLEEDDFTKAENSQVEIEETIEELAQEAE